MPEDYQENVQQYNKLLNTIFPATLTLVTLIGFGPQAMAIVKRYSATAFVGYISALKTAPLLTKAITGGVTAMLGDVMAQTIDRVCGGEKSRWNFKRNLRFFLFGFIIHGPQMHVTFKYLEPQISIGTGLINSIAKCVVLQALSTPTVLFNFFMFMGLVTWQRPFDEMK